MAAFAVVTIFALWYVDYETMRVTSVHTTPRGYGSIAYRLIDGLNGSNYGSYDGRNMAWIATQAIPFGLAWMIRTALGRGVRYLYGAV